MNVQLMNVPNVSIFVSLLPLYFNMRKVSIMLAERTIRGVVEPRREQPTCRKIFDKLLSLSIQKLISVIKVHFVLKRYDDWQTSPTDMFFDKTISHARAVLYYFMSYYTRI